jgi:hypothetical protein
VPAPIGPSSRLRASRTLGAALAAIAVLATLSSPSLATSTATISAAVSPDRLGAKGALTIGVHLSGDELGLPSPLQRAIVRFPAGMSLEVPHLRSCSIVRLQNAGASECPRQSKIGEGHALVETHPASETIVENVALSAFLGPPHHLQPTLALLGEGTTPLAVRMVVSGAVLGDRPPYGERLVMSIPPIPTLPLEPDASIVDLSLTVGAKRQTRATNAIVVPKRCPAGGFPFAGEFTYADGSSGGATTTIACPRRNGRAR